jgi:hypothetical protein
MGAMMASRRTLLVASAIATILFTAAPAKALRADFVYATGITNNCTANCMQSFDVYPWSSSDARGLPSLIGIGPHAAQDGSGEYCNVAYSMGTEIILTGWMHFNVYVGKYTIDYQPGGAHCDLYQWRISYVAQNGL